MIAAGSVIVADVPNDMVVGGNPAKVICTTDEFVKRKIQREKEMPKFLNSDKAAYFDQLWDTDKREMI